MDGVNLPSVLIIEDNDDHADLIISDLEMGPSPVEFTRVASLSEAEGAIRDIPLDAVLLDLGLPESHGLETLKRFRARYEKQPTVVMTSFGDLGTGVEAVRLGAQDFIQKFPKEQNTLYRTISYAIERKRITDDVDRRKRMLQTFAAAVGHDLTAPPRHIAFLASSLREEELLSTQSSVIQDLQQIEDRAKHLSCLLKDLMNFARLGAESVKKESVSLSSVVSNVTEELSTDDRARVKCQTSLKIFADRSLIFLPFRNLIVNGLKYWRETPSSVTIDARDVGAHVEVSVSDTGIGMPEDQIRRIFLPGKRGVEYEEFSGTGYGLAICQELIAAHGGDIYVQSIVGEGSTFTISLPKN